MTLDGSNGCWRQFDGTDKERHICDLDRHEEGHCLCMVHEIKSVKPIPPRPKAAAQ